MFNLYAVRKKKDNTTSMQEKQRGKMSIIIAQNPSTKSEQTVPLPCSPSSPHRASWALSHMDVARNSCGFNAWPCSRRSKDCIPIKVQPGKVLRELGRGS